LHLQRAKAHATRAIAEYADEVSPSNVLTRDELVSFHIQQAAEWFKAFRMHAVDKPQAQAKVFEEATKLLGKIDSNVSQPKQRMKLTKLFDSQILGGETSNYDGPRLARVQLYMYMCKLSLQIIVRLLQNNADGLQEVFTELERVQKQGGTPSEDDLLLAWKRVKQEASNAKQLVSKVFFQLRKCREDVSREDVSPKLDQLEKEAQSLAGRLAFLAQRADLVLQMELASREQWEVLHQAEELDFPRILEVCDLYRVYSLTGADCPSDFENVQVDLDVDAMSMASHFLAELLASLSLTQQARKLHLQVARSGYIIDSSCLDYMIPTPRLMERPWFLKSLNFIRQAQQADAEAEQAKRQQDLAGIRDQLDALEAAKKACTKGNFKPLLKHLLDHHPPKKADHKRKLKASVDKTNTVRSDFMQALRVYHPDKIQGLSRQEKLLYEEITMIMNSAYEGEYK